MVTLTATSNPIIVDRATQTSGTSTIAYQKDARDELWERPPGAGWVLRPGLGSADQAGHYAITLQPGQVYEANLFARNHGPLTTDPQPLLPILRVLCLWSRPEGLPLITDRNAKVGGTWYWHQVPTRVGTRVVAVGVSRTPPFIDANGIPFPVNPEGKSLVVPTTDTSHQFEFAPLFPGHHHFFSVVVVDDTGNWDVRIEEFDTLRRKLTVAFPRIHVLNDGDPHSPGEAQFWFSVLQGNDPIDAPIVLDTFHLPVQDVYDSHSYPFLPPSLQPTGIYSVGFAHIGLPTVVQPGQEAVWVTSTGDEEDPFPDVGELAGAWPGMPGTQLELPTGRGETVVNLQTQIDCPSVGDDDFHYMVDVTFSVEYVP